MRRLFQFKGGVVLKEHKKDATALPVQPARLPPRLILPLKQHIGNPAEPVVAEGDKVLKGQLIARAGDAICAPLHASSSGTVIAITDQPVPHASGMSAPCIVIDTDGEERWRPREHHVDNFAELSAQELRGIIHDAGIVGLGGAGFPAAVKLDPGGRPVDTLILNGAECEPYITCDEMLLREHALEVLNGLLMMRHALHAKRCVIGIENNKPKAFRALCEAVRHSDADVEVVEVPTIYPAGSEKQLIQVLTGKEVPSGGLPLDIGIVCHNVGTAYAVYRAVELDQPLISRYVTIAGSVAHARNLEVLIGTPLGDLIEECGGNRDTLHRLIVGGPMMGTAMHSDVVPVVKGTNCVLVESTSHDVPLPSRDAYAMPCIRCGNCADACPANLLPQQMYWYARARDFDKIQDYNLFDCIECGCCDYVCPSQIPLVGYYRYAKSEIWNQEAEKRQADLARERHQFRDFRLEREKKERAERHKKKRSAVTQGGSDDKKAAIQAAMERVRAKKSEQDSTPKNTDNLTPAQQKAINDADQRREEKTATSPPDRPQ
ncbi:MAG: electron transport complex subunit RsxC [Gammaproteobacteria bacterium]|nr:electron transport complex subunit RsxC [Gammaproteobacteria bacterium]MCF6363249.1 electron transport complex subunit RsxC [Gammaproteobacteria bacterium]